MLPASELTALEKIMQAAKTQSIVLLKDKTEVVNHAVGVVIDQQHITMLSPRNCGLQNLPDAINHFERLEQLDVTGNGLTELPTTTGALVRLKTLYADANQLMALPENFGRLRQLKPCIWITICWKHCPIRWVIWNICKPCM